MSDTFKYTNTFSYPFLNQIDSDCLPKVYYLKLKELRYPNKLSESIKASDSTGDSGLQLLLEEEQGFPSVKGAKPQVKGGRRKEL